MVSIRPRRMEHGTRVMYVSGCRCKACRRANSLYYHERKRERASGGSNEIVDATPAREHIRKLQRAGVGYRAIADVASIAKGIVLGIKMGRRQRARAQTVRKILRVDVNCRCDGAYVSARSTWLWINKLREEGYTKTELARMLGYKKRAIQLSKQRVSVRNRARVERLFEKLTT